MAGAVSLNDVERLIAKRRLRDVQHIYRVEKRMGPGTGTEAFKLATEYVYQDAPAEAGPLTKLVSVKVALDPAKAKAEKNQGQLALLQQHHDTLEGDLCKEIDKMQEDRKLRVESWQHMPMATENTIDGIRLTETEMVEKVQRERGAACVRLQKVVIALRTIIEAWEEIKDRAADMLSKAKNFYEQSQAREMDLRAAEVPEFWEIIDTFTDEAVAMNL